MALQMTRRGFLTGTIGAAGAVLVAACTPAAPTTAPTAAASAPTTAPTAAASAPTTAPPTSAQANPTAVAPAPAAAPTKAQAPAAASPAAVKRGGTLTGWEQLKPTLDPHVSTSNFVASYSALYDSLTYNALDSATGKTQIQPMLAEAWQQSDDKTFVFKLRQDVKFHDGSDWNAEAAKWNLDRLKTNPKSVSKDIVAIIDQVSVVDPYTIKVQLTGPSASFLAILSSGVSWGRTRMVSMAAVLKQGEADFGNNPSGTGPFMLEKWVKDDQIALKRNPNYWRKGVDGQALPYLDRLVFRFIPDEAVGLAELQSSGIDVNAISPQNVSIVQKDPNLVYWQWPWNWSAMALGLNAKQGPFVDNLKLRQAFAYSLDYDSLVKALTFGVGERARYVWSKGQLGYDESVPVYDYNPDKAKQLLTEAGHPDGLDVRMLTFTIPQYLQAAQTFQAMLAKTGFKLVIDSLERLAWIAKAQTFAGWEIAFWGWGAVSDPDALSRNLVSTGLGNWSGVVNAQRDQLMAAGRAEYDPVKRSAIYKNVQQTVYDEAHIVFTYKTVANQVYQTYVKGMTSDFYDFNAAEVWLNK
jgi:peptide/nickel transport system substrate-binding protein